MIFYFDNQYKHNIDERQKKQKGTIISCAELIDDKFEDSNE